MLGCIVLIWPKCLSAFGILLITLGSSKFICYFEVERRSLLPFQYREFKISFREKQPGFYTTHLYAVYIIIT